MKIALLTYHVWRSERKAGFHHIAKSFTEKGHEILFMTVGLSFFSFLIKDFRLRYYSFFDLRKTIREKKNIVSYLHFTPWHSIGFKNSLLNLALRPFSKLYPCFGLKSGEKFLSECDVIVFESTDGLMLFGKLKKLNPTSKMVYRMSDPIESLRKNPYLIEYEKKILPKFDLVSVPSTFRKSAMENLTNVKTQYHGIDKKVFRQQTKKIFAHPNNAVFVGSKWRLDHVTLKSMIDMRKDFHFHIIGSIPKGYTAENVTYYGERPFEETIPFLLGASVGIIPFVNHPFIRFFGDSSLKVLQFGFAKVPIVIPEYMSTGWEHAVTYNPNSKESIYNSFDNALNLRIDAKIEGKIKDWSELADSLLTG